MERLPTQRLLVDRLPVDRLLVDRLPAERWSLSIDLSNALLNAQPNGLLNDLSNALPNVRRIAPSDPQRIR